MDRNSALDYVEKGAAKSIEDTKEFIKYVRRECCDPSFATTVDDSTVLSPPNSPRSRKLTSGTPDSSVASLPPLTVPSDSTASTNGVTSPTSPRLTTSTLSPNSPPRGQDHYYLNKTQGQSSAKSSHRNSVSSVHSTSSTARSEAARHAASALVQPIITPRFAISCSDALMAGLQAMVGKGMRCLYRYPVEESKTHRS